MAVNLSERVELEIYSYADPTQYIDVLNGRISPEYMEEIRGAGGGQVEVSTRDPKVLADPTLLEYRNLVRVKVYGEYVGAFLIGKKKIKTVESTPGQETHVISGENLRKWFDDSTVKPRNGLAKTSPTTRSFNFASEIGYWYKPANWVNPVELMKVHQTGTPFSWIYQYSPAEWPDAPTAAWIWGVIPPNTMDFPAGHNYFRYEFTATAGTYAFFVAGDNSVTVYVDGAVVADGEGWTNTQRIDFDLNAGQHVIAVDAVNGASGPGTIIGALFKAGDANTSVMAQLISVTGANTGWKVLPYPAAVPGWTPGEIVLTLINEAKARGVRSAGWLTPTFTAAADSYGNPWETQLDWSFDIAENYSSVFKKIEELACDIWINPETLQFNMAISRGVDRSIFRYAADGVTPITTPVIFEIGKNLKRASTEGASDIANSLSVQTEDGWLEVQRAASVAKYGVIEGKLDTSASESVSAAIAEEVFNQKANPEQGATYEIIPIEDHIPFHDFNVGDWVLAPDETGLLVKRRIMSLAVQENNAGIPQYTAEFDTIFLDNEDKLNRWMEKMAGGSAGSGFSNAGSSGGSPVTQPVPPVPPVAVQKIPLAPVNLQASSAGFWSATGVSAISEVTLTWNAVTLNTDGSDTVPTSYEVQGHLMSADDESYQTFAVVTDNRAIMRPFQPGTNWAFRVRALNREDLISGWSNEITEVMDGPAVPMAKPTAPTLSSDKGVLRVHWDGILGADAPPPQFRYVYATVATSATGTYVQTGGALQRDNRDLYIAGLTVGTQYWVKLVAVDGIGLKSASSDFATHTLTGIDLGDLAADVGEAIEAAQQAAEDAAELSVAAAAAAAAAENTADSAMLSADGKNRIIRSLNVPSGIGSGGDLWWRYTAGTNLVIGQWKWMGAGVAGGSTSSRRVVSPLGVETIQTNYAPNPMTGLSVAGAAAIRGTLSVVGTDLRLTFNEASTGYGNRVSLGSTATDAIPVTAGQTLNLSVLASASTGLRVGYAVNWYTGASVLVGSTNTAGLDTVLVSNSTTTTPVTAAFVVPATATRAVVQIGVYNATAVNQVLNLHNLMIGTGDFFDGTYPGAWWGTGSWVSETLDGLILANLDAGKITVGSLNADRLAANSISTQKLLVGNFDNLLEDPSFETATFVAWTNGLAANVTNVVTTPRTGARALRVKASNVAYSPITHVAAIPVEPGDQYVFGAWVRAEGSGTSVDGGIELSVSHGATNLTSAGAVALVNSPVVAATYVFISGLWTVPAGSNFARPRIVVRNDVGNTNVYLIDDLTFYKRIPGSLIVDGAITADKIGALEITAGKLSVDAVSASNIQAGAVTAGKVAAGVITALELAAGSVLADKIAAGAITTSKLAAEVGKQLDISSNNTVNIIVGQIDTVSTDLNDTSGTLAQMMTYYEFGPTGAIISSPGSPFQLALRSDRIEMLEQGVAVSYWNSGQMHVRSFVGEEVVLGNHKLEKYLTGTVVRAL
jgi:hypothetical protein